jgi:uncharacterized protein (TIGR03000 family)
MYSVVLMMALSGGGEAVDFGHRKCHGCTGAPACTGVVVARGCTGGAVAHGCSGYGSCHGRVAHHGHRAAGCTGSCHGGGLFSRMRSRCHGSSYGCTGYGAVGCTGGAGCTGGVIVAPHHPGAETPKVMPKEEKKKTSIAPATIVVSLPADATLTVDGAKTSSTSAQRTLVTPALDTDSTYVYTLQAQVNGQTQTQQIQVRGGQVTQAQFSFPESVASR